MMIGLLLLISTELAAIGGQQVAGHYYQHHRMHDGNDMMMTMMHPQQHRYQPHHMLGSFNSYLLKKQYENMLASRDKQQMVVASNYVDQYPLSRGISSDFSDDVYPAPPRAYETMSAIAEPRVYVKLGFRQRPAVEDGADENAITISRKIALHGDNTASVERSIKLSGREFIQAMLMHAGRQSYMAGIEQQDGEEEAPPATLMDRIKAHAIIIKTDDVDEDEAKQTFVDDDQNKIAEPASFDSVATTTHTNHNEAEANTPSMLPFNTEAANQALQDANDPSKRIQVMDNVTADLSQRKLVEDPNAVNDVNNMHDSAMDQQQAAGRRQKRGVFGPVVGVSVVTTVPVRTIVPVRVGVAPIVRRAIPIRRLKRGAFGPVVGVPVVAAVPVRTIVPVRVGVVPIVGRGVGGFIGGGIRG